MLSIGLTLQIFPILVKYPQMPLQLRALILKHFPGTPLVTHFHSRTCEQFSQTINSNIFVLDHIFWPSNYWGTKKVIWQLNAKLNFCIFTKSSLHNKSSQNPIRIHSKQGTAVENSSTPMTNGAKHLSHSHFSWWRTTQ